jgi:hypothetical protein
MSDEVIIEETMGGKMLRIAIKSLVAGTIGYIFVRVMNGNGTAQLPLLGKVAGSTAVGVTIGVGKFIQEVLEEFMIDPDTKDRYDEMLFNLFSPLLAAGATLLVGWTLLGVKGMAGLMRLGLTAGASVLLTDYVYDNFLEGMIEDLDPEDLEE